jgi:hypothetical protein
MLRGVASVREVGSERVDEIVGEQYRYAERRDLWAHEPGVLYFILMYVIYVPEIDYRW